MSPAIAACDGTRERADGRGGERRDTQTHAETSEKRRVTADPGPEPAAEGDVRGTRVPARIINVWGCNVSARCPFPS